jgi:hypothetical protein
MSRPRALRRWTGAAVLAGIVALGTTGCIVAPVGGYYPEPALAVPAPGVIVAPGPVIYGPRFYGRGYYGRGYYGHRYRGYGWRG